MKVRTKKIIAIMMLVLLLLTSLPIQTFATFITDINSNASFGVISGSLSKTNHELHYAIYNGETYIVFCTQWQISSPNGSEYTYNGDFITQYKENRPEYEKIAEMIYFGYTMRFGTGLPSSDEAYRAACATQQYVWEYIHNNIDSTLTYPSRDAWKSTYMSSSIYSSWLAQTENYYNQYHGVVSFNGNNINVVIGDSTTITDTNGILKNYATFSQTIDGVTFNHNQGSNDLTISVASNAIADNVTFNSADYGLYELLPNGANYSKDTMSNYVYFKFTNGSIQDLIFSNYIDPVSFKLSVEVESGNVLIIKTNTVGDVVAGCTFDLYKDSSCTQKVGTATTDSNGQIKFERLATGTYYVKETSVPSGYLLDTTVQKAVVKNAETAEVTFKNNEPTGEITITKTDKETGNSNRVDGTSHHGDVSIKGATYTLYADEDIYNVSKSIKYFSKDEEIATFTFDEYGKATINITNKNTKASLSVSGNTLKGLPMGKFYSLETTVPTGYTQDTNKYTYALIYKDMNTPVITTNGTVENIVQKAKFEVIKISSNTNTTAPVIEGAEFTAILTKYVDYYGSFDEALKHLDEYAEDEYSIFTTGSDGHGVSGLLAYGEYTVYETYTPSDEIDTVVPFYISIDKNSDGVIKEFIENDTPFESYLKIVKIDKNTGKKVTFNNTTFSLYKLNEDTNEWEKVSCKLGKESFDSWTTDENAVAYTETKLSAGTYKIDEIAIADGFLQLDEDVIFEINKSNKTLEFDEDYDAYITVTVGNEQPTGTLELNKKVEIREDVDTSLVDISDLSGIKFKLTAKEDILDMADGSKIYEKGQEIGTYNLDKDGNLIVNNLPIGSYELEEIETLDGLVLDDTIREIVFTQEDNFTKIYTDKEEFTNDTTCVEFSKTDITGDKELEGATLVVKDKDGNVIDTWVSGDKTHKIEGLKVNEQYTLVEEIQVENYVKATDIKFIVKNDNTIQKVKMIDKIVLISKTDLVTGEELHGAELIITDKDGNEVDRWISTDTPHQVTGLEEGQEYILTEITCPYGYEQAESIEFKVTTDKETQVVEMKDMPILKNIKVFKQDSITKEIIKADFTFGIYEDAECTKLIREEKANKNEGTVTFEDLRYGTYYIKELKAPKGYQLSDRIAKVEIDDNGVFVDGEKLEEKDSVYSFTYYNDLIPKVQTGNESNYLLLFSSMVISLIGITIGIAMIRRKKQKNK